MISDKEKFLRKFGDGDIWISESGEISTSIDVDPIEFDKPIARTFSGVFLRFFSPGKLFLRCVYKDGYEHGECTTWDESGKITLVETFKRGQKEGCEYEYSEDGTILQNFYSDDVLQSWKKFDETGKIISEDSYKDYD